MHQAIEHASTAGSGRAALARQVQSLLARLHPVVTFERRRDERLAIPILFRLTPLNDEHQRMEEATITVVGKNISRRGLCFYHECPLPYRRAVVSTQHPDYNGFSVEIDIGWCRFSKPGWYESGGRLVAAAPIVPVATDLREA